MTNLFQYNLRFFFMLTSIIILATLTENTAAIGQRNVATPEVINPLEITTDPLLPQPVIKRPLSPLEKYRIEQGIIELNSQATRLLNEGKPDEAFQFWYRELRLKRALGRLEEITALGRIGAIAWENNRKFDSQVISKRLETIAQEAETETQLDPVLLNALGSAYQQIRLPQAAVAIYDKILANARNQKDTKTEKETLEILGQLYLAWFDYPNAAKIYEQLLVIAKSQIDYFNEVKYLQQLAYIYKQATQPENALKIKQKLAENYLQTQQLEPLALLKISLGTDYEALGQLESASQQYQEAFTLAWGLQQLAAASDALEKLAILYHNSEQNEYALQIYQELIKIKQMSYDFYGLMNTYDQIGEIYLESQNKTEALAAFTQGLEIAKALKYQEDYFSQKIANLNQTETNN